MKKVFILFSVILLGAVLFLSRSVPVLGYYVCYACGCGEEQRDCPYPCQNGQQLCIAYGHPCQPDAAKYYSCGSSSTPPTSYCGDGSCDSGEDSCNCNGDCGGSCTGGTPDNTGSGGNFCDASCPNPQCGGDDGCGGTCSNADDVWGSCRNSSNSRVFQRHNDCSGWQKCNLSDISGTFFDASLVDDCSAYSNQPPISGVSVTATATVNQPVVAANPQNYHANSLPAPVTYNTSTDGSGNYAVSNVLTPDVYDISYSISSARYVTDPPKLLCNGALTGISMNARNTQITRRVGLYRIYGGWFQNTGGDIYGGTGVSTAIPATCSLAENNTTCNNYTSGGTQYTPLIITPDYGGTPGSSGMVFTREGTISLGGGGTTAANAVYSQTGYNSTTAGYTGRNYDYGYFYRWFGNLGFTSWNGSGKPTGAANYLYQHTGNITWDQSLTGDEKIVILVDGNVTINTNIDVPVGAYLSIISSGDITIEANVTQVEGHFIADNITVETTGDTATDQRFTGEGTFVGWTGINLRRDRGNTNNSQSSELFIFRPDLVINAPRGVRNPKIGWQEVAP